MAGTPTDKYKRILFLIPTLPCWLMDHLSMRRFSCIAAYTPHHCIITVAILTVRKTSDFIEGMLGTPHQEDGIFDRVSLSVILILRLAIYCHSKMVMILSSRYGSFCCNFWVCVTCPVVEITKKFYMSFGQALKKFTCSKSSPVTDSRTVYNFHPWMPSPGNFSACSLSIYPCSLPEKTQSAPCKYIVLHFSSQSVAWKPSVQVVRSVQWAVSF